MVERITKRSKVLETLERNKAVAMQELKNVGNSISVNAEIDYFGSSDKEKGQWWDRFYGFDKELDGVMKKLDNLDCFGRHYLGRQGFWVGAGEGYSCPANTLLSKILKPDVHGRRSELRGAYFDSTVALSSLICRRNMNLETYKSILDGSIVLEPYRDISNKERKQELMEERKVKPIALKDLYREMGMSFKQKLYLDENLQEHKIGLFSRFVDKFMSRGE